MKHANTTFLHYGYNCLNHSFCNWHDHIKQIKQDAFAEVLFQAGVMHSLYIHPFETHEACLYTIVNETP